MMNNAVNRLKKLIMLNSELQAIQDLDVLLEKILTNVRQFVNADAGTIYLTDGKNLVFSHTQNDTIQKKLPPGTKLIYSVFKMEIDRKSISGYVAGTKEILNIPDVYEIPEDTPYSFKSDVDQKAGYRTVSMLTIPLVSNIGELLGVIQVINAKDVEGNIISFDKEDELLVQSFANTATIALQRARLTRQIILRMISMAELRDPKETGPHVNRVAGYAVEIYECWAARRNMPKRELERNRDLLRMAAMLHDVGKVAISDVILKKNGPFNDEEYEMMKTHTFQGALLFKYKQSEFDEVAAEVALTHHENWDGTGYPGHIDLETGEVLKTNHKGLPLGLKGEEIPIFGRVVALADVYDALSSKRCYKDAWGEEDVFNEIKILSGKKFDPELVEIFFETIDHLKNITKRYPDEG